MKRVAAVEDNPDNRLLVRAILNDLYEVQEFDTSSAALAGMRENVPDVVLMDISLPEMDGTEVLERLSRDAVLCRVPVIALTAHVMAGDREKYLQVGFHDYVSKPITEEAVLLAAIARCLDRADA